MTKKTPNKKTRKAAPKRAAAKKSTARKAAPKKAAAKRATAKRTVKTSNAIRRPDSNRPPTAEHIDEITFAVSDLITEIDGFVANLRALDRQRHNGVGMKRLGFIEAALRISSKFPQYYPHWLDTEKFQRDLDLFKAIRSLVEMCRSLEEKAWNINVESSDMVYTDALEYYSQVQDAARRRIDAAETLYEELHGFFRNMGTQREGETTNKKLKRDINALLHGAKDGEIVIKNISAKKKDGARKIVDETFKSGGSFKETDEGEINE